MKVATNEVEVLVVGAGPAGLATAIGLALRGRHVHVIDRLAAPWDKACGEGLMAPGVAALTRLGIVPAALIGRPLRGVHYIDGAHELSLSFGEEEALGLRRTRLNTALRVRAGALGVTLERATLSALGPATPRGRAVTLSYPEADAEGDGAPGPMRTQTLHARWVVGADGLRSRVRRLAQLEADSGGVPARFGLRQHVAVAPWSEHIEVHLGVDLEAYVTPVGYDALNIAFLGQQPLTSLGEGLARMPALARRLGAYEPHSRQRGAGPLAQAVRAVSAPGVALIGDAAGYVDANTGEGLSLAFLAAESLAMRLSKAPAPDAALPGYDAFMRQLTRRYRWATRSLLWLGRHRRLRNLTLRALSLGGGTPLLRWATALPRDPALSAER